MTPPLGVNITLDPSLAEADCALAASLGAKWVRTSQEQDWGSAASRLGPFRTACDAHGLKLWNTCQPTGHLSVTHPRKVAAFAAYVVGCTAYCDATGTGNESNGFGVAASQAPNPYAYAKMLKACIALRDTDAPGKVLITPELCPGSGTLPARKGDYVEPLTYLKAMEAAVPGLLSAEKLWIGWHPYCDPHYDSGTPQAWNTCYRERALSAWVETAVGHTRRIAGGEFGTPTGPPGDPKAVDQATQALRFDQYIAEFDDQEAEGVHHAPHLWYALRDKAHPTSWADACGLVTSDGTPKTIASHFASATGAS